MSNASPFPRPGPLRALAATVLASLLAAGCGAGASGADRPVRVVASVYPLAWLARSIGDGRARVVDLTPPGVEAHDVSLSAAQVAEVAGADVVLIPGFLGFQPQVEQAARSSSRLVIQAARGLALRPSAQRGLAADPHVWLDPVRMERMAERVAAALASVDPAGQAGYEGRARTVVGALRALDAAYRSGLADCRFRTLVTTHEAFGYLAARYGLTQVAVEGLTPEAEPGAARIRAAEDAIREGRAGPAVFFEPTAEGERVGATVASAAGVPAVPLDPLEFAPRRGDYLSTMRSNLARLEEGLRCR